jgi:integrase
VWIFILQSSGKDIAIPLVHLLNRTDPVALTIRIISTAVILFRHNLIIALRRSCHGPSLSVPSFFNISSFELNDSRRECAMMAMIPAGAMVRDAGRRIDRNPFNDLPANWWPRLPQREPDPYTEQERDALLAYYRANRPPWAYAFVHFRFWTGTRPSQATAFKWGSVDLLNARATIALSRHLGEENAPKTRASRRTITLLPNVVELLKTILPLRVEPNNYVFTDG